jgi:hypothetical protein
MSLGLDSEIPIDPNWKPRSLEYRSCSVEGKRKPLPSINTDDLFDWEETEEVGGDMGAGCVCTGETWAG